MEYRYCGLCRGERGCKDCTKAVGTVAYESITAFSDDICLEHKTEENVLFWAADLGTTTLGFVCADATGRVLASFGTENPQREISADVIGRIDAACCGKAELLMNQIREALAQGFLFVQEKGSAEAGEKKVKIALAGNTTMQHLLLGYSVEGLAKAPFLPHTTEGVTVSFSSLFANTSVYHRFPETIQNAEVFVFPCPSAFVGGDVLAGAYGLSFPGLQSRGKTDFERTSLLADLGTNGELILSKSGRLYATATAMGCAFEGGRFAYASDLFAIMARARREGAADATGLLVEPYFSNGFHGLSQEDVRSFQLAKGAIRAGIELLCKRAGITAQQIDRVYLAGGAGRFCKEEDLYTTGLFPQTFRGKLRMVGNSCIGGLLCYLKNPQNMIQWKGEVLNMAREPEFESLYYRYMEFDESAM